MSSGTSENRISAWNTTADSKMRSMADTRRANRTTLAQSCNSTMLDKLRSRTGELDGSAIDQLVNSDITVQLQGELPSVAKINPMKQSENREFKQANKFLELDISSGQRTIVARSKDQLAIETAAPCFSTPKRHIVNTTKNDFGLPPLVHHQVGGHFALKKNPYLQKGPKIKLQT